MLRYRPRRVPARPLRARAREPLLATRPGGRHPELLARQRAVDGRAAHAPPRKRSAARAQEERRDLLELVSGEGGRGWLLPPAPGQLRRRRAPRAPIRTSSSPSASATDRCRSVGTAWLGSRSALGSTAAPR